MACRFAWLPLLAVALLPGSARAQVHSRTELREQAVSLEAVARACGEAASACTAGSVPEDEQVAADGPRPKFTMRWQWLQDALEHARSAPAEERQRTMATSAARLEEIARDAGGADDPARQASLSKARHIADTVLARAEFGAVAPPSAWDRFVATVYRLIGRLFAGFGRLGAQAPWLGKALEWIFFFAAAVGLLLFVRRNFQRQQLQASLRGEQTALTAWDRQATDWAALAERAAAASEWREAVHCLYWAAIVRLEGRRAWRHNPARTPREYVRLLQPGSVQRESLGGLTGLLERVWYGLRPAAAEDYQRARTWFERLSDNGMAVSAATPLRAGSEQA